MKSENCCMITRGWTCVNIQWVLIEKQDIRARHGFVYDLAPLIDVEDGFFYFYIDKVMYSFC